MVLNKFLNKHFFVLQLLQEEGWLMGMKEGTNDKGMFPANFTKPLWISAAQEEETIDEMLSTHCRLKHIVSINNQTLFEHTYTYTWHK